MRSRPSPFHWLIALGASALLGGCSEEPSGLPLGGIASPPPSNAQQGGPGGEVETSGTGRPTVRFLEVEPTSATLNAPAADGSSPAGFPTRRAYTARVVLSNGQEDAGGVTWSVSDATRLSVDPDGTVAILAGAASGSVAVTATSKTDPSVQAHATLVITTDGLFRLSATPSLQPEVQTVLNVTQDGRFILNQPVTQTLDVRMEAGSYDVSVQRYTASGSTFLTFEDVVVTPNGIASRKASFPD